MAGNPSARPLPLSAKNAMEDAWHPKQLSAPCLVSGNTQKLNGRAVQHRVAGLKLNRHMPYCSTAGQGPGGDRTFCTLRDAGEL